MIHSSVWLISPKVEGVVGLQTLFCSSYFSSRAPVESCERAETAANRAQKNKKFLYVCLSPGPLPCLLARPSFSLLWIVRIKKRPNERNKVKIELRRWVCSLSAFSHKTYLRAASMFLVGNQLRCVWSLQKNYLLFLSSFRCSFYLSPQRGEVVGIGYFK